jgi:hypothetical protein
MGMTRRDRQLAILARADALAQARAFKPIAPPTLDQILAPTYSGRAGEPITLKGVQ